MKRCVIITAACFLLFACKSSVSITETEDYLADTVPDSVVQLPEQAALSDEYEESTDEDYCDNKTDRQDAAPDVDTFNACDMHLLGRYGGESNGLQIQSNTLYLANGSGGLYLYDISLPSDPYIMGISVSPEKQVSTKAVSVCGSVAFLAESLENSSESRGFLRAVEISDPQNMQTLSVLSITKPAKSVLCAGGFIFLGTESGIRIYDAADPSDLKQVSVIASDSTVHRIKISGHTLIAATYSNAFIVNISDPGHPSLPQIVYTNAVRDIAVYHNSVYLITYYGFALLDLQAPGKRELSSFYNTLSTPSAIDVSNEMLYIAGSNGLVELYSLAQEQPELLTWIEVPSSEYSHMVYSGGYVFLSSNYKGVFIVYAGNEAPAGVVSSRVTPSFVPTMAVAENYVYLSDWDKGLLVVDNSAPGQPEQVARLTDYGVSEVLVYKDTALVVERNNCTIHLLKVFANWYAKELATYKPPVYCEKAAQERYIPEPQSLSGINSLAFDGTYAYLSCGSFLHIINVLTNPVALIASVPFSNSITDIAYHDRQLYVLDSSSAVTVLDLSVPAAPHKRGTLKSDEADVRCFALQYPYVVLGFDKRIAVYSFKDPGQPQFISKVMLNYDCDAIAIRNRNLALIAGERLQLYEFTEQGKILENNTPEMMVDRYVYTIVFTDNSLLLGGHGLFTVSKPCTFIEEDGR